MCRCVTLPCFSHHVHSLNSTATYLIFVSSVKVNSRGHLSYWTNTMKHWHFFTCTTIKKKKGDISDLASMVVRWKVTLQLALTDFLLYVSLSFFLGKPQALLVHCEEIYLNGCQVLLLLWRRLMDKPQPVGIAWVTSIQNIQYISFTATDLEKRITAWIVRSERLALLLFLSVLCFVFCASKCVDLTYEHVHTLVPHNVAATDNYIIAFISVVTIVIDLQCN